MDVVNQVETLIQPALRQNRYELVETQYRREAGGWVLRIFIDREAAASDKKAPSPVNLSDCEKVSNLVGELLDASELLKDSYTLEVSSPGINRPLKNSAHFQRFIGQKVRVTTHSALSETSNQKNFAGVLLSCKEDIIEVHDVSSGRVFIPISSVAKANLDVI